jgi:predicted secreted protein
VTEAMKNEIMKKHKLYQKAKKSNEENDWKEFKDQKTRVATMIREAKLEYIGNHPEEVRFIVAV